MKTNLDDPNLTAYALGELSGATQAAMEEAVAQSPEAQKFVQEIQQLAGRLTHEFRLELEASGKPLNIMPLPGPHSFWSDAQWMSIGVAALLAVCAIVAAVVLSNGVEGPKRLTGGRVGLPKPSRDVQMEFEPGPTDGPNEAAGESGFVSVAQKPVSTIPIAIRWRSYIDVRGAIEGGAWPTRESVRIEELINGFAYENPRATSDQEIAMNLEIAGCPWREDHRLARVAFQAGKVLGAVKAEVEFNPAEVRSYRLIGYDHGRLGRATTGAKMVPGDTVTVLYEIVPSETTQESGATLTARIRYVDTERSWTDVAHQQLYDSGQDFASASPDFKFAAAVAGFGMMLRALPEKSEVTLGEVIEWAEAGRGRDIAGDHAGFIELLRQAQRLTDG